MKYPVALLFFLSIFSSCQPSFDEKDLVGKWKTIDWSIADTGEKINNKMNFDFKADKTYSIDYGIETEKGKYWIAADYLETVEDGMTSKKVKILKLTPDTFQFRMNRAGRLENVLLVK